MFRAVIWLCCILLAGAAFAQTGETCASAIPIATLPYCYTGTTTGFNGDYIAPCIPAPGGPDVVFAFTPTTNQVVSASLCGSSFNTVLHIWMGCPPNGVLVCCNDDFCGLQSCCENITLQAGRTYFFIVTGVGNASGNFILHIVNGATCPGACTTNTCPYPNRDQEPLNNYCAEIYDTLACGDTVCGTINPNTDLDYYHIRIPGPNCMQLTINVYGNGTPGWYPYGQGLDPMVSLLDSVNCSTYLASDDNGGVGNDAHLVSACLRPGLYRILVQGSPLPFPGTTGPYILTTSCTQCACNPCPYPNRDQEPLNNYCLEIYDTLACGDTVCGRINPAGDVDYYHIRIPGPGCERLTIDIFGNGTPGWPTYGQGLNPIVYLMDSVSCTTYLASDDNGGISNDAHLLSPCLRPGLYRIRIEGVNSQGPYILATSCSPCPCDTCRFRSLDFEPLDNTCGFAGVPPVSCPDTLCGRIDNNTGVPDQDWYSIVVPPQHCEQVTINVYGNDTPGWYPNGQGLDPFISLYASDCSTLLATDDNSGVGNDAQLTSSCLQPGTYWIKITGANFTQGPYVLTTQCNFCACACPYPNRDQEPLNNYCAEIYDTLACGDTVCGAINPSGDLDYYHIRIPGPNCMRLTIDVFGNGTPGWYPFGQGLDPIVYLLDSVNCSAYLAQDDNSGIANDAHLVSACLRPGLYKILIRGSGTPSTMGPYILTTACSQCSCDTCRFHSLDFEPADNSCNPAVLPPIGCPDTLCGRIDNNTGVPDEDWYSITVPPLRCEQLTINVYGNDTPGWFPYGQGLDPFISLYASDCSTLLATDDNSGVGNDAQLTSSCLQPGTYWIKITGAGFTQGPYVLTTACTVCTCNPPLCPYPNRDQEPLNNYCLEIYDTLACGDTVCGNINPLGDEDYYHLLIPGPQCEMVMLNVFGNGTPGYFPYGQGLNPYVTLYANNCTTILAQDDNSGIANDAYLVSVCLSPGMYKIKVSASGNATTGPYILAVFCHPCTCDTCRFHNLDIEPVNNTCNSAVASLACPDTVCGRIANVNGITDVDWYSITIPPPRCLQLTVNVYGNGTSGWYPFGLGLDPRVDLYASDCSTLLGFDDNSGIANDSRMVSPCLQPGTYMIKVQGMGGTQGPYVLTTACSFCQCACVLPCPPNFPMDGEACPNFGPDTYNGGCSVTPPAFRPIECGHPFCATSFAMGGFRDTDWYQLNLTTPRRILWAITGSFPFEMAIYAHSPGICDTIRFRYATGQPCQTRILFTQCLPVGTYYLYVAPTVTNGVPCSNYISRLSCGKCFVHGVVISTSSSTVSLAWESDDTQPVFNVYRSTAEDAPLLPADLVTSTTDTTYMDTTALQSPQGRFFYTITMQDPDTSTTVNPVLP